MYAVEVTVTGLSLEESQVSPFFGMGSTNAGLEGEGKVLAFQAQVRQMSKHRHKLKAHSFKRQEGMPPDL